MKILLLGKNGQVGWELQRTLLPLGEVYAFGSRELDISDFDLLAKRINEIKPGAIINAAAYTEVDKAESEPDLVFAINATAPGVLAEEALRVGAAFIHYSTDYVFDGVKGEPYTEADAPNPVNTYGRSKLAGEQAIQGVGGSYLILRTAWVYSSLRRGSFVTKVLRWAREQKTLRIVDDQVSNPTWARRLAEVTKQVVAKGRHDLHERSGLYHLTAGGCASRFEWAQAILELDPQRREQTVREMLPASTGEFPTPARRPLYSALESKRMAALFAIRLPAWRDDLQLAMSE